MGGKDRKTPARGEVSSISQASAEKQILDPGPAPGPAPGPVNSSHLDDMDQGPDLGPDPHLSEILCISLGGSRGCRYEGGRRWEVGW